MAFRPSLPEPEPTRAPRGFAHDADDCVDDFLALAEWLRDRRAERASGELSEDSAA